MDFVAGLSLTHKKFDAVWVIVDRRTKSAHFIPVAVSYSSEMLAEIYIREIVRLHGVPVSIITDRGTHFTSQFWRAILRELSTQVELSTAFHPQMDGQSERTIQILEDMPELVLLTLKVRGISSCLKQSLPTTITTSRVSRWLLMRLYMVGGIDLRLDGWSRERLSCWVHTWFRRPCKR